MIDYHALNNIPPLVQQAMSLAETLQFPNSCSLEVGRLLQVLAGQQSGGAIAEIGTGCGVGAAWIVSGMSANSKLVTVELDPERATACADLFQNFPNVQVLNADWQTIIPHGPFSLVFGDAAQSKRQPELFLSLLQPDGLMVLDDLTPLDQWPPEWRGQPDPVRDFWLTDPRLHSTEILVTPHSAAILATKKI